MPLYEYRCEGCGGSEERLESLGAPDSHDCEHCGRPGGMKRQISAVSFSLAGGGWYKNGYSGTSAAPKPKEEAPKPADKPAGGCCGGGCACHG